MNLKACICIILFGCLWFAFPAAAQQKRLDAGALRHNDFIAPQKRVSKTIAYESEVVMLRGLPVLDAWSLTQVLANGRIRTYTSELREAQVTERDVFQGATHWCPDALGGLLPCREVYISDPSGADVLHYTDENGTVVLQKDPKRYHTEVLDSQVWVNVFYPNPVVTLNEKYGNRLFDNDDKDSPWLDSALQIKSIKLLKSESGVEAETDWFRFRDLSNPLNKIPNVSSDSVLLTRSHPDFEHFNVLFHLEHFSNMLVDKGHAQLRTSLVFDPRALNNRDQSAFNPYSNPPSLEFGLGGVDDGEDAQVIIHEYAHALCHQAAPHSNIGRERRMIEEGTADFLAMYYSQRLKPNFENDVFSWDGHNEYWEGLSMNSRDRLDELETSAFVAGRQIWSTCLKCIADHSGWDYTSDLVLESLYYLRPELLMRELGTDLLFIDSVLSGGRNYSAMKQCLIKSGILFGDHRDVHTKENQRYTLINSEGFARKQQDAHLAFKESYLFEIIAYDVTGRCVYREEAPFARHVRIPADIPATGSIVIHVILKEKNGDFKDLLRLKLLKMR